MGRSSSFGVSPAVCPGVVPNMYESHPEECFCGGGARARYMSVRGGGSGGGAADVLVVGSEEKECECAC